MELNIWISKIKLLDNNYFNNTELNDFIKLINYKYLVLYKIKDIIPPKLLSKKYILIWDCEFQMFESNIKCNKISYEFINNKKMIRCISEMGILLLLNIKNELYLGGIFHCCFMNRLFNNDLFKYTPFYSDYISVENSNEIIKYEQNIYPHLKFKKIWDNFQNSKNDTQFNKEMIKLLNSKILTSDKHIYTAFKSMLEILIINLENNEDTDKIIKKINKLLMTFIYSKTMNFFNNNTVFKDIFNKYLNDNYIKKIIIPYELHQNVINLFYKLIYNKNCINIIKGLEDIKAINNHNFLLNNCKGTLNNKINIIDIAIYNDKLSKLCSSAKLYDTYKCLFTFGKYYDHELLNYIKLYTGGTVKPHNPLIDAYYTYKVYIMYKLLFKKISN
jgi:hypothetical protein